MLKRVLVANRGEIAVRIIRACMEMGIETVAVYSEADKDALHTVLADKAVCIGAPPAKDSYLNIGNIIEAAKVTGCDSVHPGFGFLSENSKFAEICEDNSLIFIGPPPAAIALMGDKAAARECARTARVPVVPGTAGTCAGPAEAAAAAKACGFPVLLKAAAGGGGRGLRRVNTEADIEAAFRAASSEAESAFGDGSMYVEKFIENPRHIEVQILADKFGNVVHLGERDCSMQRRNQKLIEEAPAAKLSGETARAMREAAVRAAKACGYVGAGTCEFVVDRDENFYFIEMNTRIQVEHPVTEAVTGIDIVKEQIKIASGEKLSFTQDDVEFRGHAIECRITAEDVSDGFRPCPGKIEFLHFPGGPSVRVDSAIYDGCEISPYYDSMIGKIIVHGENRADAIRKMRRALSETVINGVKTTLPLSHLIMYDPEFLRGGFDTGFLERRLPELLDIYRKAGGDN